MKTDKLKELIDNSDLVQMQKNILNGFVMRSAVNEEQRLADRNLIETVANEKKLSEVVFSNGLVKIYTVSGKDEWSIKYPYRIIFVNDKGVWERNNNVSQTIEIAFLVYLGGKYLGNNSQFVGFAVKMLEIKLED